MHTDVHTYIEKKQERQEKRKHGETSIEQFILSTGSANAIYFLLEKSLCLRISSLLIKIPGILSMDSGAPLFVEYV